MNSETLVRRCKHLLTGPRARIVFGVILITLVGGYFRIAQLGECSMRADTIEYWKVCSAGLTPTEIIFDKARGAAAHGIIGWPIAYVRLFLNLFHLPLTFFTIRLPLVLFGIMVIPLAYLTGRHLGGWATGLMAAALMALSPFHIQCSREAYPYVISTPGAFLAIWAMFRMVDYIRGRAKLTILFYVASFVAVLLLMKALASSQPFALIMMAVLMGLAIYRAIRRPRAYAPLIVFGGIAAWGLLPKAVKVLQTMVGGTAGKSQAALHGKQLLLDMRGLGFFSNTAWGDTPLRLIFTLAVILLALVVVWKRRSDWVFVLVPVLLLVGFPLWMVSRYISSAPAYPRYMAALQPIYVLLLSLGLTHGISALVPGSWRRRKLGVASSCVLPVTALALLIHPAFLVTKLPGTPVPYKQISEWCNTNLPPGTPVLCDYWLAPWNQFRVHPSTNVTYTYTVPNEPADVYIKNRWRDTAVNFLTSTPGSAYLEINKRCWEDPRVGPWHWPREYFVQKQTFTNEPFLALMNMGLNYRQPDRRSMKERFNGRVIVELFYNDSQDIADHAKAKGRQAAVVYGSGWGYTKTRDMRDWRVLQHRAQLNVYNLTDSPQDVIVAIKGVSVGGVKTIIIGIGVPRTCKSNVLLEVTETLYGLPPGLTVVTLRDALGDKSSAQMLVGAVKASVVEKKSGAS